MLCIAAGKMYDEKQDGMLYAIKFLLHFTEKSKKRFMNLLGLSDAEIYQTPNEPFLTDSGYLMNRLSVTKPRGLNDIYQRVFKGSMPELYADKNSPFSELCTH